MSHANVRSRDETCEREEPKQSSLPADFASGPQFAGVFQISGIDEFGDEIRNGGLVESRGFRNFDPGDRTMVPDEAQDSDSVRLMDMLGASMEDMPHDGFSQEV
jgi:hypothetical protein